MRRRFICVVGGGGVVECSVDSKDMEPRVRFCVRLGASVDFASNFFSKSLVVSCCNAADLSLGEYIYEMIMFLQICFKIYL